MPEGWQEQPRDMRPVTPQRVPGDVLSALAGGQPRQQVLPCRPGLEADAVLIPPPHDEGTDEAAQVDRLMRQYDENTHRESLTAADEAGFVAELLDLGMSAATIQRRARLPKATVQAAQAVRESDTARAAVSKHTALTIQQAAGIAEFDGNPEAVKHLIDAAERGSFDHQLQRLGDSRKEQEAIAAKREELEAEGIRTSDARLS
jgi:ParB family chromosome partitioning protein